MKNIYSLFKINRYIKSVRIKNLIIYILHLTGKRYFGIFIDPVFACNLRCRMCYFSDEEKRKTFTHNRMQAEDLDRIAGAFFHRALKLQIGCGAEPSLFPHNIELIRLGKVYKVPYISFITNANRLKDKDWRELVAAGLDEITLSLHGVTQQTYEYFMTGASFETFCNSLQSLTDLKKEYPNLKIRINYTVNQDNLQELVSFFDVFGIYSIDILQIRPIQNMGQTAYSNFSWHSLIEQYDETIETLRQTCVRKQITCIAPGKKNLLKPSNADSNLVDSTYFYISPAYCWENDFNWATDTYESYAKRTHLGRKLLTLVFKPRKQSNNAKKKLNYEIK
jgi:molybdenum cofactor biosynthesis enzyme MoaA